jgi:hypothetical protein
VVNASLNWASIVGIVLAVGGALLYFMRSFKPALARDYDVFFAAVGLLCGGILFFQGWRLDPILQFGQFLLASTTVFFAYESVRLRGVTTDQARRSSYFDEDEPVPSPAGPFRPRMAGRSWDEPEADRFDEPQPLRRRIPAPSPRTSKRISTAPSAAIARPSLSGLPAAAPRPKTGTRPRQNHRSALPCGATAPPPASPGPAILVPAVAAPRTSQSPGAVAAPSPPVTRCPARAAGRPPAQALLTKLRPGRAFPRARRSAAAAAVVPAMG